jgi:hypothetical protein
MINREKSSVFFSANASQAYKNLILQELQLGAEVGGGKYLDLPMYAGKSKKVCFAYIKDNIISRLQGGLDRCLSTAGKEVYIKAVAQAIPTYAFSCFDMTKSLCDEISQLVCNYWWNRLGEENRMHWIGWERMTLSKKEGGLRVPRSSLVQLGYVGQTKLAHYPGPELPMCSSSLSQILS